MSEGDSFLHKTVHDLTLTFRASEIDATARPVSQAERIVREFCTKELKSFDGFHQGQLGVQQYISNATMDLIIMAIWRLVADTLNVPALPVSEDIRGNNEPASSFLPHIHPADIYLRTRSTNIHAVLRGDRAAPLADPEQGSRPTKASSRNHSDNLRRHAYQHTRSSSEVKGGIRRPIFTIMTWTTLSRLAIMMGYRLSRIISNLKSCIDTSTR